MQYLFILGSHELIYRGITCFCHKKDNHDEIIHQMENSSKKDKVLHLFRGGDKIDHVKLSDWKTESASYFNRFFAKRLKDNDIICIPQHGPFKDVVMRILKEWCLMGNTQGALIVQNFDLSKHLEFLRDVRFDSMNFKNEINQSSCYLAYNFNQNVILYLRGGKGNNSNENIEEQMGHCISDLLLLLNLYQDELKFKSVRIIGLVISNSETRNFQLKCELCKIFVISVRSFENSSAFHFHLEKFFRWFAIPEPIFQCEDSNVFSFCSKMLSLMACTKCKNLPNFTSSETSQLEQACLFLNPEQMEVLYSSGNTVILKGNFGTGKTIVLQKKLEDLALKSTEKDIIYYFNYDRKSNAIIDLKNFIKCIPCKKRDNIRIKKNRDGLQMSGIFQSILKEVGQDMRSVHVFIDEYNGEDLTQKEVDCLKKNLQEKHFKDSVIFIASQPIEKERIDTFQYSYEEHKSEGNLFSELKNDFRIEELTYVMRTTVQINTVMKLLQNYLQKKQNEFIHFQSQVSGTLTGMANLNARNDFPAKYSQARENSENLFTIAKSENEIQVQGNDRMRPQQEAMENNQNQLVDFQSVPDKIPTLSNISKSHSEAANRQKSYQYPTEDKRREALDFKSEMDSGILDRDDLDLAFKEASKLEVNQDKATDELKTTTRYTYISQSETGHNIESLTPKLILLDPSGSSFENIVSYSAVLIALGICERRLVIIHFEWSPPSILMKALNVTLKLVNTRLSVTLKVEDFMSKKNNCTLVTNFRHVRGMEFKNVVVIVDPEEYFLKHYLPEAIARCTSNLSLLMLEEKNVKEKKETLKEIVELLHQQKPSVVETWITRRCEECRTRSKFYCLKNDGHGTYLGIHTSSDKIKKMSEHFNPDLHAAVDGANTVPGAERV